MALFPHLTPSSVGLTNIAEDIEDLCMPVELYYVSRTYMTRHGAGPMEYECLKQDINPHIVDNVNQPNEWQGSLRFGYLNTETLYNRIRNDKRQLVLPFTTTNIVFTQTNYTNGKLATSEGLTDIVRPGFCDHIYVSDDKTHMEKKE